MGLFSRFREARQGRIERRTSRRKKRRESRQRNKEHRIEVREARHTRRVDARDFRKQRRLNKRQRKFYDDKYGEGQIDENAAGQAGELNEPMNDALAEQGVAVDNPNDNIEVATKYAQMNEDIANPTDDETYNNAFVDTVDDFESHFEYAEKQGRARGLLKVGLGAVMGGVNTYLDSLKEKEAGKQPLTSHERDMLDASQQVGQSQKKGMMADLFPVLAIVIVLLIVFKVAKSN